MCNRPPSTVHRFIFKGRVRFHQSPDSSSKLQTKQRFHTTSEQAENPKKRVGDQANNSFNFFDMTTRNFSTALTLIALVFSLFACVKTEDIVNPDTVITDPAPSIPEGNRIIIHFGTSTYRGCMYSFSNCIWIGWGTDATNFQDRFAMTFDQGDAASQYFGNVFPLTSDFEVDEVTAAAMGIPAQTIPAGFYPLRDIPGSVDTGRKMVDFAASQSIATGSLLNPNNPQDNIGQLHNLAVQVVLHENRDAIKALNGDRAAVQKLIAEKTIQFFAEADLPVNAVDKQRALNINLDRDFGNYAARLNETRLSANDKQILLSVFDEAAAIPVETPAQLKQFIYAMTTQENRLARETKLDNPKVVLSMVSVLKNSRYFWYWKSVSSPDAGNGGVPNKMPDWVWADIIGLELGGPAVSAIASAVVYLDQH